ncbi:MAG: hypothetical protein ACYC1Q_06755, partial [Bacteroidia bacterium]
MEILLEPGCRGYGLWVLAAGYRVQAVGIWCFLTFEAVRTSVVPAEAFSAKVGFRQKGLAEVSALPVALRLRSFRLVCCLNLIELVIENGSEVNCGIRS